MEGVWMSMNIIEERREENPWFEIGASSMIGGRHYQQDFGYIYTGKQEAAAVVCDGMGGMEGGERASRTAVELFAGDLHTEEPIMDPSGFLYREAARMDLAVAGLKGSDGRLLKSGTTLAAVYCRGSQMYWVSVGDSMIYRIRGNSIEPVNQVHNYRTMLQEQLAEGSITREFYEREEKTPQAEALTSYLGMNHLYRVETGKEPFSLEPGDMILLCSDGVYKSMDQYQILAMARDNDLDMKIAAERTTAMALQYGGKRQDNTTVILMKYGERQEEAGWFVV